MMNERQMMDELEMLDARLGAHGQAHRSAEVQSRVMQRPQPQMQHAQAMPHTAGPAPGAPAAPAAVVPPPAPPATSEMPRGFIPDLRSWSSNYRFTPEMEYIKISRTGPAMYNNVNATGWLCDVYQPIDEQYLGSVWGGGTYVIVAYQNSGGGAREVARGYTQINGNPRAYRGPDGQPITFPNNTNNQNTLPGVPAPHNNNPQGQQQSTQQVGQGVPFPVNNTYVTPPAAPAPAIDLISLAEKFSGNKQEAKSLEVLQAAQAQNNQFYKGALDRSLDEQKQLREQLMTMQQNQAAPMQNAIEMYRAQMETRERAHADTMKQMVAEHTAQLQALRQQADKAIEEQRRGFDATLQNMREENRSREQSVRDSWRVEVDNLRRELDAQRQAATAELQRYRETSTAEIQRLRDEQRRDLDNARRDVEVSRTDADRREQVARDSTRAQYETQIRILENQISSSKEDVDRRETNARETARSNYESQIRMLENQVTTIKEQLEQRMNDMRLMNGQTEQTMRATFDLQLSQRDNEITRLRDELNTARSEATTLRADLTEKRDPMTTLNEVANLTQTFQNITGQNNPGPAKEEEPKGFMAQLAKYAPSIGEHLVKPTMKPIAEVVETVRERERREEELRRDILMRRQALQQRPNINAQQAMIMQQQQQQQQAFMQQQQQQQQAFMQQQQQQAARNASVPAPVVTVKRRAPAPAQPQQLRPQVAAPTNAPTDIYDAAFGGDAPAQEAAEPMPPPNNAMNMGVDPALTALMTKDLLSYIDQALTSNTAASDLADQMKMGANFGVIEPEIITKVQNTPVDTVVNLFAAAADQYGIAALASPRGEDYIANVHAALLK